MAIGDAAGGVHVDGPLGRGMHLHGEEVLARYAESLTEYERAEVREYAQVFWAGLPAAKRRATLLSGEDNHGYDDERGDYHVTLHDHLHYRYEVLALAGKGSFGQVVRAYDHRTQQQVAIKVIRNKQRFHKQALVEVKVLTHLRDNDPHDETNTVRMLDHFCFRGHLCVVFELLSMNLYDFIKNNCFMGVSFPLIRRFAVQLLNALRYFKSQDIVHCDMKPENVLLCSPGRSAIKVIDFGSSCFEAQPVYTYIQSRFYRSPEILLGLPYFCAIDMWSFGCIVAELYSGAPLFPGENELEQLACIMEVLGPPPTHLVSECSRRKQFFDADGAPRIMPNSKGKKRRPASTDIMSALKCTDVSFVSFLEGCLRWDASERFTPEEALQHEWIAEMMAPSHPSARAHPPERPRSRAATVKGVVDAALPSHGAHHGAHSGIQGSGKSPRCSARSSMPPSRHQHSSSLRSPRDTMSHEAAATSSSSARELMALSMTSRDLPTRVDAFGIPHRLPLPSIEAAVSRKLSQ